MHSIINADFERVVELAAQRFAVDFVEPLRLAFRYFDTFDWLLYNAGRALLIEQRRAAVVTYTELEGKLLEPLPGKMEPRFWWEFPDGEVRAYLAQTIGPRALLIVVDAKRTTRVAQFRNEDDKIVVRLVETTYTLKTKTQVMPITSLHLEALRGYEEEYEELKRTLLTAGILLSGESEPILKRLTEAMMKQPGDYSPKPVVTFSPDTPAAVAVRELLLALLATVKANEAGIKADLDTEFLHDYRVASRKARAVLSQVKAVWSPEMLITLKNQFSAFGTVTNKLRDLDVYLLKYEDAASLGDA